MADDDDPQWSMEMPFVAVTSKGGPYDDNAYVGGFEMGRLDHLLSTGPPFHEVTIHTPNAGQADLIAMRRGYRCETTVSEEWPEWTFARFTRIATEAPSDG